MASNSLATAPSRAASLRGAAPVAAAVLAEQQRRARFINRLRPLSTDAYEWATLTGRYLGDRAGLGLAAPTPAATAFTAAITPRAGCHHIHARVEGTRLTLDLDGASPSACLAEVTRLLELIYDRPAVALGGGA